MPLLTVIFVIVAVAVLLWAINRFLAPYMDGTLLTILNAAVAIFVVVWLLSLFGVFDLVRSVRVGP